MIYNGRDDLHKMNFGLEFIRIEKLVMCFDGWNNEKNDKIFLGNKWGNKEYIIIKDSTMKRVGLKVQAPLKKNQWCYFETIISSINK
jgi:hypothetical protein